MGGRGIAWVGVLLFAVSWFVPVHAALDATDEVADATREMERVFENAAREMSEELERASGEAAERPRISMPSGRPDVDVPFVASGPPGWRAFRFAWDLLTKGDDSGARGGDATKRVLLGLTSLTNVVMLVGAIVLLSRGSRALGIALLACAALNAGWLYLTEADLREGLRAGYWLWLASFAVVGLGHVSAAPKTT